MNRLYIFITSLALLLLISYTASGQLNFGIRAGIQSTTLNFNGNNLSWKTGFHSGIYASYDFNKHISITGDLLYSEKGYRKYDINFKDRYLGVTHLNYLSLPLTLQFRPGGRFSILAGGEFDVLLSNYLSDAQAIRTPNSVGYPPSDSYLNRRTDIGMVMGLAFQVNPHISLMLRYTRGYRNLASGTSIPFYNQALQFSLGYSLYKRTMDSSYFVPAREKRAIISIGVRQGISSYSLVGSGIDRYFASDPALRQSNRTGYDAGLELRFDLFKYLFASIGVSYFQKGGYLYHSNNNYINYPVALDYIGVPIVTGFSPIKTRALTISVEGGLVVNYEVSAQNASLDISNDPYLHRKTNIVSTFYGLELSTNVLRNYGIFVSYRRITDVTPFTENNETNDDDQFIHQGKSFSAGMRLRLTQENRGPSNTSDVNWVAPFSIGVKGGINLNNVAYRDLPSGYASNASLQPGGHLGVFFQIKIYRNLFFMPEVQYITKGYKYSDTRGEAGHLLTHYVEQPFMIGYALSRTLSIEAGPTVGFFLWSNQKGAPNDYKSEDFNLVEFGMNGGLRYSLSQRISLACRYYRGTKNNADVFFSADGGHQSSTQERNENFQFSTYFRLK